jgi:hypothetical protein
MGKGAAAGGPEQYDQPRREGEADDLKTIPESKSEDLDYDSEHPTRGQRS